MKKKKGGTIRNWQLHHLKTSKEGLKELVSTFPDILIDPSPMIFTGTVVKDPTNRWKPGFHIKSSLICKIDRKNGIIETLNTIYNVIDEGNDVFGDLGNDALNIFY